MDYKLVQTLQIPLDQFEMLRKKFENHIDFIRIFDHIDKNIESILGSDYMKCYYYHVKLHFEYDFIKFVSSNNKYTCMLLFKCKDDEAQESFLMMMSKDIQVVDVPEESKYFSDILKFIEEYRVIV